MDTSHSLPLTRIATGLARDLTNLLRRPAPWLVFALAIWGLTDVRSRGRVDAEHPGVHKTDFTVYTEAGAAFFDGRDPYAVTNPRGWGYLYPPLFAILIAPLHALPEQGQVVVWFLLSVLSSWGCYREIMRMARVALGTGVQRTWPTLPAWVTAAAITAVTLPGLNCLQRGQVGMLKLYLLLLGFRLLLESRSWWRAVAAGLAFALAIALKVTPVLPAGLVLLETFVATAISRRSENAVRLIGYTSGLVWGLIAWFLIVPAALVGWQNNTQALDRWWNLVAVKAEDAGYDPFAGNSYSVRNQSLMNSVRHLGNWIAFALADGDDDRLPVEPGHAPHVMDAQWVGKCLLLARIVALLLATLVAVQAAMRGDRLTSAAAFGLACVVTLIVSPIARVHYFVLVLPAVAFVPCWFERAGHVRLARWLAWLPGALVLAHYVLLPIAGRAGALGIGIALWYVASALLMLTFSLRRTPAWHPPEITSFRVTAVPPQQAAALCIDHRVAGLALRPLLPNLAHHEADG